jgi:chromosome segregation ATPase
MENPSHFYPVVYTITPAFMETIRHMHGIGDSHPFISVWNDEMVKMNEEETERDATYLAHILTTANDARKAAEMAFHEIELEISYVKWKEEDCRLKIDELRRTFEEAQMKLEDELAQVKREESMYLLKIDEVKGALVEARSRRNHAKTKANDLMTKLKTVEEEEAKWNHCGAQADEELVKLLDSKSAPTPRRSFLSRLFSRK